MESQADGAIKKEYTNLETRGCWNINDAEELSVVAARLSKEGTLIHIGSMFELLYLKHSELAYDKQKLKGRVVFLGDRVRDQHGMAAVFEALASSPAGIEVARFVDTYGLMATDGTMHTIEQADTEQAYTQAKLDTKNPTFARVPHHMRKSWMKPGVTYVMPLIKALYGHPQAGVFWERRLHAALLKLDFVVLGSCGEWRSVYFHPTLKVQSST